MRAATDGERRFSARPLRAALHAIDAEQGMTDMESVFRCGADEQWKAAALVVLGRWAGDPTLSERVRDRAKDLAWNFSPNGWDEV